MRVDKDSSCPGEIKGLAPYQPQAVLVTLPRASCGCDCRWECHPGIHPVPLGARSWLWPSHHPVAAVAETLSLPCYIAEKAAVLVAGLGDLGVSHSPS